MSVGAGATDGVGIGEDLGVCLLDHEQRNVFEGLAEVETVAAAEDKAAVAEGVEGEADAGAEVEVVVLGQAGVVAAKLAEAGNVTDAGWWKNLGSGDGGYAGFGGGDDLLVGAAVCLRGDAVGVDVAVVTEAEVEEEARGCTPVVLKVEADHFGSEVESRIAEGAGGGLNGAGRGVAGGIEGRVGENGGGSGEEVELGRGVVFEEAADLRLVDEVDAHAQGVLGEGVREVIAELEFMLAGFLRDVDVGAEADAVGEGEVRLACSLESMRLFQYWKPTVKLLMVLGVRIEVRVPLVMMRSLMV